jgi:hypothetical protein
VIPKEVRHQDHEDPRLLLKTTGQSIPQKERGDGMDRGYMGKVLWVDLSNSTIREEKIPDEVNEKYLSGLKDAAHLWDKDTAETEEKLKNVNKCIAIRGWLNSN